jgi:hypothetical protein
MSKISCIFIVQNNYMIKIVLTLKTYHYEEIRKNY